MAKIPVIVVRTWEYERGWGSSPMGDYYFRTLEPAEEFVKEYNKENTLAVVPDWYCVASNPFADAIEESEIKYYDKKL